MRLTGPTLLDQAAFTAWLALLQVVIAVPLLLARDWLRKWVRR